MFQSQIHGNIHVNRLQISPNIGAPKTFIFFVSILSSRPPIEEKQIATEWIFTPDQLHMKHECQCYWERYSKHDKSTHTCKSLVQGSCMQTGQVMTIHSNLQFVSVQELCYYMCTVKTLTCTCTQMLWFNFILCQFSFSFVLV